MVIRNKQPILFLFKAKVFVSNQALSIKEKTAEKIPRFRRFCQKPVMIKIMQNKKKNLPIS